MGFLFRHIGMPTNWLFREKTNKQTNKTLIQASEITLPGNSGDFEFKLQSSCKGRKREVTSQSCPLTFTHMSPLAFIDAHAQ